MRIKSSFVNPARIRGCVCSPVVPVNRRSMHRQKSAKEFMLTPHRPGRYYRLCGIIRICGLQGLMMARLYKTASWMRRLPGKVCPRQDAPVSAWACLGRRMVCGLTTAVLLASGCITTGPLEYVRNGFKVGPNYSPPSARVAEEWIEARDPKVQDRHLEDWWHVFQDPILDSLVENAVAQN